MPRHFPHDAPFTVHSIVGLLGVVVALAPSPVQADVRFGADVGPSIVWTAYDEKLPEWETGNRIDVSGGVTALIGVADRFGIVTGLRYSGLGTHIDVTTIEGDGQVETHQHYLVVPAWLRYDTPGENGIFLQAGAEVGYLLSASISTELPFQPELDEEVTGDLERTNVSLGGGFGVRQPLGDRSLEFTLRYSRGLTGVAKEERWFSDWKTRELHLSLGVR